MRRIVPDEEIAATITHPREVCCSLTRALQLRHLLTVTKQSGMPIGLSAEWTHVKTHWPERSELFFGSGAILDPFDPDPKISPKTSGVVN